MSENKMTAAQIARVLRVIRVFERRVLSSDSKPTTAADIRENGRKETESYYHWLREQAPTLSYGYSWDFDEIMGPASRGRRG